MPYILTFVSLINPYDAKYFANSEKSNTFAILIGSYMLPVPLSDLISRGRLVWHHRVHESSFRPPQATPPTGNETHTSPDGGIGRRAGLKHQWSNPCRFDPGSGYRSGVSVSTEAPFSLKNGSLPIRIAIIGLN